MSYLGRNRHLPGAVPGTIILLDGRGLGYTVYYAIKDKYPYSDYEAAITSHFLMSVRFIARIYRTNHIIFCWDDKHSFREEIYPPYKGDRESDVGKLLALRVFDFLHEKALSFLGFNTIRLHGLEADDIMASLCDTFTSPVVMATDDKDLYQKLRTDKVWMHKLRSKELYSQEKLSEEYNGLTPADWADVKAIGGCKTDNVPGAVTELKAIRYALGQLHESSPDYRIIESSHDIITRNRKLTTLPFGDLSAPPIHPFIYDSRKFVRFCNSMEFHSFLRGDERIRWRGFFANEWDNMHNVRVN